MPIGIWRQETSEKPPKRTEEAPKAPQSAAQDSPQACPKTPNKGQDASKMPFGELSWPVSSCMASHIVSCVSQQTPRGIENGSWRIPVANFTVCGVIMDGRKPRPRSWTCNFCNINGMLPIIWVPDRISRTRSHPLGASQTQFFEHMISASIALATVRISFTFHLEIANMLSRSWQCSEGRIRCTLYV